MIKAKIESTLIFITMILPSHATPAAFGIPVAKEFGTPAGIWRYVTLHEGDEVILFIHGAGSSRKIWKDMHLYEVTGQKLIFVDLLGYGESDKPENSLSLATWIEGLNLIVRQEKARRITVVAHSNGVILAKEFYRANEDLVSGMVLLDGMLRQMLDGQMLEWMKMTLDRSDYKSYMEQMVSGMPTTGLAEREVAIVQKDALDTPKLVTGAELEMISDKATWREIVIKCPVIIVHANNPLWSDDYNSWLFQVAPNHQLLTWRDAGHFLPLQYPEKISQLVKRVATDRLEVPLHK